MNARTRMFGALAAITIASSGCGGSGGDRITLPPPPPPPPPVKSGFLTMTFVTTRTDDGAALLTVNATGGAVIDSVQKATATTILTPGIAPRMLVTGALTSGVVLGRVWVPDISKASSYSVTVDQVAARATYAQRPTTGYSVTLQP